LDVLRSIRFENETGYYFAIRMDGMVMLNTNKPELEGKNLLGLQDTHGKSFIKGMIKIGRQSGEGFDEYYWVKPGVEGNDFKKISFIKIFKPYSCIIGAGLYVEDVEEQIKKDLLSTISRIRFGKEGYIFINRLNGDALVSNGKLFSGTKKLWEVFNKNPDKMKNIFEKEYHAALKPEGDYIYYSHIKLTDPNEESPKASFIHGIPELQWLVGAGVYLDDVETDIALIQTELNNQIKVKMFYYILIIIVILAAFFLFYNWLNQGLKKDFKLFISFLNRAAHSYEKIDRENIKFVELDQMAECANKMLTDRKKTEEALVYSEQKWRNILLNIPQIGISLNPDAKIIFANDHFQKLTGWKKEEIIGQDWFDMFIPEKNREEVWNVFKRVMRKEDVSGFSTYENDIVLRNGELRHISWANVLTKDVQEQILDITCLGIDLTELKRSEKVLRENEEKYRSMMEAIIDAVYICSSDFKVEYMNPVMIKRTGRDAIGELCYKAINNLDQQCPWCVHDQVQKGETIEIDMLSPRDNRLYNVSNVPISHEDGSISKMTIYRDITNKKQAEKEQILLSTAIEQASESIIISDGQGKIQYINPSFEQLSGFDPEDLIGQNFRILKSDKHDEAFYREMYDSLSKGKIWIGHITNTMKDGTLREFETRISPVHDSSGEIINYVSVNRDVTQEVALEAQLRQSQKMEAIGTLAGGVAHDFNNLLTVINGNAHLAFMQIDKDSPLNEYIEEIKDAGNNAALLTRQLLAFSRKQIIQPKVLSLNKVLDKSEKMLRRLIREDIELTLDLDSELWPVNIDPGQIEQIMMNLVVNAKDAMPGGGKLLIETANAHLDSAYFRKHGVDNMPGAYAMIAVTDNGTGMDEETRDRIFEPFFTTKELGHGTGLGLSTVYGIVKQHNGYVWIYSEPGKGTTFKVYFPKAGADEVSDTEEQVADDLLIGSATILVVEDSKTLLKMTQKMLEKYGYRILTAQNGREALEVFSGHGGPIHLILTDVVMPKMGGWDLAKKIQSEKPEVKIIYMSGYPDNAISDNGMLHKDVNFVQKPFSSNDLARKVREVLDK